MKNIPHIADSNKHLEGTTKVFRTEVTFGNPNLDCARFGICKLDVENVQDDKKRYKRANAICEYDTWQNTLTLLFKKANISKATYNTYFAEKLFLVEEDCSPTLHIDFQEKTQITSLNIAKGVYICEESGSKIKVKLATKN